MKIMNTSEGINETVRSSQGLVARIQKRSKMSSFGTDYAEIYDILYRDKDYEAEASYVLDLLGMSGREKGGSILEIGCGTGGHAKYLSAASTDYVGMDLSPFMVELAHKKLPNLRFVIDDLTRAEKIGDFDCCIGLFHAFGYLTSLEKVESALRAIKLNLKKKGIFLFDIWNGLSVISSPPQPAIRKVESDSGLRIIRYSNPMVDFNSNLVTIKFDLLLTKNDRIISTFQEDHVMRFYYPSEISYVLGKNGFRLLSIRPFMKLEGEVTPSDKGMAVVCESIP